MEGLYNFSQQMLHAGNQFELLKVIPKHIVESFKVGTAALFLSDNQEVYHWGLDLPHLESGALKEIVTREELDGDLQTRAERSILVVPLVLDEREIGSLRVSGCSLSPTTVQAIATLIVVAVERARAIEHVSKVEAARESERLKSVLLDAITHDFKTPLTSIKGSATGLLANLDFDREQQRDLLLIIDEECDQINRLINEASDMTRLETGQIKVEAAPRSGDLDFGGTGGT